MFRAPVPGELELAREWAVSKMVNAIAERELSDETMDEMLDALEAGELSDEEMDAIVMSDFRAAEELSHEEAFDYVMTAFPGGWESFLVQVVGRE
jgi:hypothetical protein